MTFLRNKFSYPVQYLFKVLLLSTEWSSQTHDLFIIENTNMVCHSSIAHIQLSDFSTDIVLGIIIIMHGWISSKLIQLLTLKVKVFGTIDDLSNDPGIHF